VFAYFTIIKRSCFGIIAEQLFHKIDKTKPKASLFAKRLNLEMVKDGSFRLICKNRRKNG